MKPFSVLLALCGVFFFTITSGSAASDSAKYQQLAQQIVSTVLQPKSNDTVLIFGGPENLVPMEHLATDLRKVGAFGIIVYSSNRMQRMYYDEVPARYDSQYPRDFMGLIHIAKALVVFDNPNDPSVTKGVPTSRLTAGGAYVAEENAYLLRHNIAFIDIGNGMYPSVATASQYGISLTQLSNMYWNALAGDYGQLRAGAVLMAKTLQGARRIHVTAPNGTDITFSAVGARIMKNDGVISAADRARGGAALQKFLPAGDVYFIPVPGSANGTVVFGDEYYNGVRLSHMQVRVRNGRVVSMSASSGAGMVQQFYAKGGLGRDLFTSADFGVNPALQFIKGSSMFVSQAAGMVSLGFGDNTFIGGTDRARFAFSGYIPYATVTADDRSVAVAGKLSQELTLSH